METTEAGVKPEEKSPVSSDVKGPESSTEQLEKDVTKTADTKVEETETPNAEEPESSTEAIEQEEQTEAESETEEATEPKTEEAVPYERFKEVNGKVSDLESKVKTYEPQVARIKAIDDYVQQHSIRPEQLQSAFEYLKHINSDPAKAYEMLKPTFEKLAEYVGDRLPTDLQDRVAAGTLDAELAKEIARGRADKQYQTMRQQAAQGQSVQQQAQQKADAVSTWASTKMTQDPDFKPSTTGQDGKWEYVHKELIAQGGVHSFESPQKAIAATEAAYDKANKFFSQFNKTATVTKKPIKSTSSRNNASAVVRPAGKGGEEDIVRAIMSGNGKRPPNLRFT